MGRVMWIQVAALSGPAVTPGLARALAAVSDRSPSALRPPWPAVTCTAQASATTGVAPGRHGVIANGFAPSRVPGDLAEIDLSSHAEHRRQISFWEQGNPLVQAPRLWEPSLDLPRVKTAMLFWQNSMPGFGPVARPAADVVLTPKPVHGPDGKTLTALWSEPSDLQARLTGELGPFPLMHYWGPMSNIRGSQWIAAAAGQVWEQERPDLQLVYLPHLDYALQRDGPGTPAAHAAAEELAPLIHALAQQALADGADVLIAGDYGIRPVTRAVLPNVALRQAGLLATRDESGGQGLDLGHSRAFAMVDHQLAHVFCQGEPDTTAAEAVLRPLPGVARVLRRGELAQIGLDHPRSGDLVILAEPDAWLAYPWDEPARLPSWARGVDIHAKPGYDPCELFFVPTERRVGWDPSQVRGSHGLADDPAHWPVAVASWGLSPEAICVDGSPDLRGLACQVRERLAR